MCGRFGFDIPKKTAQSYFMAERAEEYEPRKNIAPTSLIPALVLDPDGARALRLFTWGLIPGWVKDPAKGPKLINARAETAWGKPSFSKAMRQSRCLVPATIFYEWKKCADGAKKPYGFEMADKNPFAMAGIWERRAQPEGGELKTLAILTTGANELVLPVHERMPVILPMSAYDDWLDITIGPDGLREILRPYKDSHMSMRELSPLVNNPNNQNF